MLLSKEGTGDIVESTYEHYKIDIGSHQNAAKLASRQIECCGLSSWWALAWPLTYLIQNDRLINKLLLNNTYEEQNSYAAFLRPTPSRTTLVILICRSTCHSWSLHIGDKSTDSLLIYKLKKIACEFLRTAKRSTGNDETKSPEMLALRLSRFQSYLNKSSVSIFPYESFE